MMVVVFMPFISTHRREVVDLHQNRRPTDGMGMRRLWGWWRRRGQVGQVTVEFVLLLPAFLALSLSMLEFGWWVHARIVVANASSAAAEAVAQQGIVSTQTVPQVVNQMLKGGDLDVAAASYQGNLNGATFQGSPLGQQPVICAPEPSGGFAPEPVTVTVTYHYHPLFPFLSTPLFLDIGKAITTTFSSTSTMSVEQEWVNGAC